MRPNAAEIATLTRLAAVLCPEMDVDEDALRAFMGRAGITDRDLVDPDAFGPADMIVARSFAQSFAANPRDVCGKLLFALGPGGGGFLCRAGKPV